jgi:sulfite exporter TauE/SafE
MKSFLIATTVAVAACTLIADSAFAKSKRGMAGMAAMAPMIAAGVGMIGSSGFADGSVATPYIGSPINTYVDPGRIPNVSAPFVPGGFGLGAQRHESGG